MLELFCHAEIGILMKALADEMVLAMIAVSWHWALDILCDKSETGSASTWPHSICCKMVRTADGQCNTMGAVIYRSSASTLSRALEVVGSASLVGSLPNCPAASSAADGFPSVVSHDCDRIVFLESCHSSCSDGDASVDVTSSTWLCGSNGFLVRDTPSFESVCKVLSGPSKALLDDDPVEGSDGSSLTLGEARGVACADGCTAVGSTETTITCIFDTELPSRLLKGSTYSCKLASRDHSPFTPPPTVSHDCPETVLRRVLHRRLLIQQSQGQRLPLFSTCGSGGALVSDLTPSYPTCQTLACPIGDLWLDDSLSGPGPSREVAPRPTWKGTKQPMKPVAFGRVCV